MTDHKDSRIWSRRDVLLYYMYGTGRVLVVGKGCGIGMEQTEVAASIPEKACPKFHIPGSREETIQ